ncbi:unnamed protein product [Vicia faba]|uniref:phospholipase D n=1 Tax=Vicia faba TaxID=3906 RepID=A0AAV1B825_VICFA|nr:unnamed protein product [Vicia faba]
MHHHKCVLLDSQGSGNNRKITTFIGGLDLCDRRDDTPEHRIFHDLDTVFHNDFHNPTFQAGIDRHWCKAESETAEHVPLLCNKSIQTWQNLDSRDTAHAMLLNRNIWTENLSHIKGTVKVGIVRCNIKWQRPPQNYISAKLMSRSQSTTPVYGKELVMFLGAKTARLQPVMTVDIKELGMLAALESVRELAFKQVVLYVDSKRDVETFSSAMPGL